MNPEVNYILPLTHVCCLYIDFNTIILYKSLPTSFIRSFLRQLNKYVKILSYLVKCWAIRRLTLLNFNNFHFSKNTCVNNALNRFSTMFLHSEMTPVALKAKTQKCKPSLGPGVKTV